MSVLNKEQSEFAELMNIAGWKRADVVRELGITKASVSKILSGKQTPRPHLMEVFRQRIRPEVEGAPRSGPYPERKEQVAGNDPPALREKFDQLRTLEQKDPEGFRVVSKVLDQFSSKVAAVRQSIVADVAAKAERGVRERRTKPKADGHTGKT
jgi:antitoxin component HigA of HigAB toxin-antitoxin module